MVCGVHDTKNSARPYEFGLTSDVQVHSKPAACDCNIAPLSRAHTTNNTSEPETRSIYYGTPNKNR